MPERKPCVVVVDDAIEMARVIAEGLSERGYQATAVSSGAEAVEKLTEEVVDALVTDLRMPGMDGLALLAESRRLDPERPVIIMTAFSAIDSAIESVRRGAYHYLTKPFKQDELVIFLGRALEEGRLRREATALKSALRTQFAAANIIGSSAAISAVRERIERIAAASAPVLILGETGTGKGLVARALHADSPRAGAAFVHVNCAALPEALLESELFGYVKGAFTGAVNHRAGLFAEADGGTLFMDEIGEMSPVLQAKLLHVLESGRVRPVGASKDRQVDVRVIAATHRNLTKAVREGTFRADLLFRLDVVSVTVPALADRREDIPALLAHFLAVARARHPRSEVIGFSKKAMDALLRYAWPGNVRELAHTVERAVLLAPGAEAGFDDLPDAIREGRTSSELAFHGSVVPMREVQRRYAAWALAQSGGQRGRTAQLLEIDGKTLAKWLSEDPGERGEPSGG